MCSDPFHRLMHSPNCLLKKTNHGVLFTTLAEQQRAHRPAITVNASELDSSCSRQEVERCLVLLGGLEGQIMSAMPSCVAYPHYGERGRTTWNLPKLPEGCQGVPKRHLYRLGNHGSGNRGWHAEMVRCADLCGCVGVNFCH